MPKNNAKPPRVRYLYPPWIRFVVSLTNIPVVIAPALCALWLMYRPLVLAAIARPFYVFPMIVIGMGWYIYTAIKSSNTAQWNEDNSQTHEKKRVAVIGGGLSGLITAKELLEEGHQVVIYEKSASIGGVWASTSGKEEPDNQPSRIWESTVSSSSAFNSAISDFPLRDSFPENVEPNHVTAGQFGEYLKQYATCFNLVQHIRFHHSLETACFDSSVSKWNMVIRNVKKDAELSESFDHIAICTGQAQTPRMACFDGQESFKGSIDHVSTFTNSPEKFAGKRVVAVGAGESASDVVAKIAEHAESISISIRNPTIVLPRNLFGSAPDAFESRALYMAPRWFRWLVLKFQILLFVTQEAWARVDTKSGGVHRVPSAWLFFKIIFTKSYFKECATGKRSPCASLLVTKTEDFLYAVVNGKCTIRPGITQITEDQVFYKDGTSDECDAIVLLTGYRENHTYLSSNEWQNQENRDRYMLTFHPRIPQTAFVGFCRGQAGSLILPIEMQARWFALIVSGKRSLPSPEQMQARVDEYQSDNKGYAATLGGWFIANYIARHFVHCEPCPIDIINRFGFQCALRVYTRSYAGHMFRFRGPHAKPEIAAQAYADANQGKIVVWTLVEVMGVLLGALVYPLSKIPIIGQSRLIAPLNSVWW